MSPQILPAIIQFSISSFPLKDSRPILSWFTLRVSEYLINKSLILILSKYLFYAECLTNMTVAE